MGIKWEHSGFGESRIIPSHLSLPLYDYGKAKTMVTVIFLPKNHGRATEQLGTGIFYAIPLENYKDFSCTPKDLISFEEAKQIAYALNNDYVIGEIGEYEWRRGE